MALGNGKNGNGHHGQSSQANGAALHYALPPLLTPPRERLAMGTVVRGSLQTGIQMKLAGAGSVEDIRAGKFVVVDGARHEFFAMITDVTLDCASPGVLADPPATKDPADVFLRSALAGTTTFGTVTLKPLLMRTKTVGAEFEPVKTVPTHFSEIGRASCRERVCCKV